MFDEKQIEVEDFNDILNVIEHSTTFQDINKIDLLSNFDLCVAKHSSKLVIIPLSPGINNVREFRIKDNSLILSNISYIKNLSYPDLHLHDKNKTDIDFDEVTTQFKIWCSTLKFKTIQFIDLINSKLINCYNNKEDDI